MSRKELICPIDNCIFSCRQESKFKNHLVETHAVDPETVYVSIFFGGTKQLCGCGCARPVSWLGWTRGYSKYLRGHNARIETSFTDPKIIQRNTQKRIEGFKSGKYKVWNDGLTKKTDPRIFATGNKISNTLRTNYDTGITIPWQSGLTKETSNSVRQMSMSRLGRMPWNHGLTKKNNTKLHAAAQKISSAYRLREAGKRLSAAEIDRRLEALQFDLLTEDYQTRKTSRLNVRCRVCNTTQSRTLYSLEESRRCFACSPQESQGQREILDFVTSLGFNPISNDRRVIHPLELDIVIPEKSIAIEYNGLYWHCDLFKDKRYHSTKLKLANDQGYRLFYVYEDEWHTKRNIIMSMLKSRLGLVDRKINARSCVVTNIAAQQRRDFFNENHIDGDVNATFAVGLLIEDELIACMSFRRPFHRKWNDHMEMARFAVKQNVNVRGALSRLTAAAFKHSRARAKIISYVDTRYGDGHGYIAAGYQLRGKAGNNFWWTDYMKRYNRFSIRADKKAGISESAAAVNKNMRKIWGCPQLIMEISK